MMRKIFALVKKDFLVEASYKLAFLFNLFSVCASLLVYFFIDKLFSSTISDHLRPFEVGYFAYVLLSMAFFSYIGVGIGSFAVRIRQEQMQGTLESLLLTPTKTWVLLGGMALWNIIFATLDLCVYLILGVFLFGLDFSRVNVVSALAVLLLSIISFGSLGIFSASFILVFKRGNPVGWVLSTLEGLLGGVYFPVTVLPMGLQIAARCFPITYAVEAMQLAVYRGYSCKEIGPQLLALCLFCLGLVPLSILSFNRALKKARQQGSLSQY
ncbi:MAG: ABC transporter permease [Saprospiraceae bacterium]|nr:ABC transporter permease [Saprospiraceae bacterium]